MTHALQDSLMDDASETSAPDHGADAVGLAPPPLPPAPLPPPLPSARAQTLFARHWRGEYSLPRSYWLNHVVLGIGVGVSLAALAAVINQRAAEQPVRWLISLGLTWGGIVLFSIWAMVGVWRAATAHRAGGKRFWGTAAKVTIGLGVLNLVYSLCVVAIPQASGVLEILGGDKRVGPHHFKVMNSGTMLDFTGGISFGTAKEFETMLNAMDNVRTVRLNSSGGRIAEAQKISDLIRARGLSTYVTQQCLSACTIVFLGGEQRYLFATAKLGFHQSYFRGQTATDRRLGIAREEARLEHFGLSRAFAEHANAASPASMWFPDQSELLREHVVTMIVQPRPPKPVKPAAPAWPAGGTSAPAPFITASAAPTPQAMPSR